jgi:hypothetical protein
MHCYLLGAMASGSQVRTGVDDPTGWPVLEHDERPWWSADLAPLGVPNNADAVRQDLDMARAAGLDALALLISNHHFPTSQYLAGDNLVAQVAATHQVKIIPDLWPDILTYDQWVTYGQNVKNLMDAHPGAFMTYQGKPVISLGFAMGYGRGHPTFQEWSTVQGFFNAWGGSSACYIIAQVATNSNPTLETAWGNAADAFSFWGASLDWGDPLEEVLSQWKATYGKPVFKPASPAYYCQRPGCELMSETLGLSRFCDQWRRAIAGQDGIEIETWNDFSEDHCITATNYRGRTLIELTRYFADWLKQGTPPTITEEQIFLFHHRQLTTATTQATTPAINWDWKLTPTTDYLYVVTLLKTPGTVNLRVDGSSDTWTLTNVPAGLHEWLVYVPCPRTTPLPDHTQAYTRPTGSYPTTDSNRTVTVATSISAGTPKATLSHGSTVVATVTGRHPLVSSAAWQDLCMIGTSATDGLGFDNILDDATKLSWWAPTAGTATMTVDTTTTWQGCPSLRYDITSSVNCPGTYNYLLVEPNSTYQISCVVKGQNLTFNDITHRFLQFDVGPAGSNFWTQKRTVAFTVFKDQNLSGTFDWTPVTLIVTTQAGDGAMRFRIGLQPTTTGTFWIAGVRAHKLSAAMPGLGFDGILNDPTKLAWWAPTVGATMTPDTTTTWQGNTSLRYDLTSEANAPGTYNYELVEPNTTYLIYCAVKGENLTFSDITHRFLQFDVGPAGSNFWTQKRTVAFPVFQNQSLSGTFDWTPVALTVTTQAGDGAMRFRIGLQPTTTGKFWIAGIRAYKAY